MNFEFYIRNPNKEISELKSFYILNKLEFKNKVFIISRLFINIC